MELILGPMKVFEPTAQKQRGSYCTSKSLFQVPVDSSYQLPQCMRLTSSIMFPGEDVENICLYKGGGYHPVKLGDIFQTQSSSTYRVLHKLGSGSFATVWLARDLSKGLGTAVMRISLFS